jgi:predicted dehydrogenase/threonine dehydrogenase-like Zn-dependent dehydrogenase
LQNLRTGATEVGDVPCPALRAGHVLIRSERTLVSVGTEKMLVDFGRAGWVQKARQQPDKVRMVADKVRTDGVAPTVEAVLNKLDQPVALGYCNVGTVLEVGSGVSGLDVGDRVLSNGKHAEVVSVPANLCVRVPDAVSPDQAVFTVMGAIALQGIRLAAPTLGEGVVVTGLGLIGLLTVQLLRAHGCRVLGIDFDPGRLALARGFGAEVVDLSNGEDPLASAAAFSRGRGVDAVVLTASTRSSEPVHQAALMCRKRGRIVLVGVTGLELSRSDFYEKELSFQVSCSYGPGRYDANYEEKGLDYPIGFVRWTEQRNFEAVLDMIADSRIAVEPLITHRFRIEDAHEAYQLVSDGGTALGILLEYAAPTEKTAEELRTATVVLASPPHATTGDTISVAFVGSGNYATSVLIPAFKAAGARLTTIASRGGVSGVHAGRKHGFQQTTTDPAGVMADGAAVVAITTRHDSHAGLVVDALAAGKHVFVEKPLALTLTELNQIEHAYTGERLLMVGFNRRFAPLVRKTQALLTGIREPKVLIMTVNAGAIPADHWTQDPKIGGGRIVGEACHFIDLLRFLTGAPITGFRAASMGRESSTAVADDKATITLHFADGSLGIIHYLANGHKSFPKERLEVFAGGRVLQMNNYRNLIGFGWPRLKKLKLWRQDKGQRACVAAFIDAVRRGRASPVPFDELLEVSRVSIEVAEALR